MYYLWLILNTIVKISYDVATSLQDKLTNFGKKGLRDCYPGGENVEEMVVKITAICTLLSETGNLYDSTV